MTQPYVVYKKFTSNMIQVKIWGGKTYYMKANQNKSGLAILISHKIDFQSKKIIRDKEALQNNKKVNSLRKLNLKCVYTLL